MSKSIEKYIRENIGTITKLLIIYLVGIIVGIVLCVVTNVENEYASMLTGVLENIKLSNYEGINIIANGIRNNAIFILFIYLSTITFIAPLLIVLFVISKAILTGVYICTLFKIFGILKGIVVVFTSVIIPLIFSLSGYIGLCTNVLSMFKLVYSGEKIYIKSILKHVYFLVVFISLICFSLVLEQFITRLTLSIYIDI